MSSIRSILEELQEYAIGYSESKPDILKNQLDQAIKDISELIDKAKPDYAKNQDRYAEEQAWAFNHAIDEYQSNLKELLK